MNQPLKNIGIRDDSFELLTVNQLVAQRALEKPLDGNHGELHPKGEEFVPDGVPFIMATDIHDGTIDYTSCNFITAKQAATLRKGFARNGDVLITHKATIGRTAIVRYDKHPFIMLTPQVTYYRVKDYRRLNNHYLRYYFNSALFQKTLHLWANSGSTRAYLGITEQQKLPIIVPPIEKQLKIASVLSAYDELIENNKHRIARFGKIAEEIYREWFVRLRFPGHENARTVKGLPEHWERVRVAPLTSYLKRGVAPSYDDQADGIAINQKCIRDGKVDLAFARHQSREVSAVRQVQLGDILVNSTGEGTLGRVAQVYTPIPNCIVDSHVTIVRPKPDLPIHYFGMTLKAWEPHFTIMGRGATNQTELAPSVIGGIEVVMPSKPLQSAFEAHAGPIFSKIAEVSATNDRLVRMREMLLPRLISGKLSVANLDIAFPPGMVETVKADSTVAVYA